MKLKELKDSNLHRVVKIFIPKEILDQNLIIAGGFATWLLYLHMTVTDWDKLFIDLEEYLSDNFSLADNEYLIVNKFSDIDLWVTDGHPFLKSNLLSGPHNYGETIMSASDEIDLDNKINSMNEIFFK